MKNNISEKELDIEDLKNIKKSMEVYYNYIRNN